MRCECRPTTHVFQHVPMFSAQLRQERGKKEPPAAGTSPSGHPRPRANIFPFSALNCAEVMAKRNRPLTKRPPSHPLPESLVSRVPASSGIFGTAWRWATRNRSTYQNQMASKPNHSKIKAHQNQSASKSKRIKIESHQNQIASKPNRI